MSRLAGVYSHEFSSKSYVEQMINSLSFGNSAFSKCTQIDSVFFGNTVTHDIFQKNEILFSIDGGFFQDTGEMDDKNYFISLYEKHGFEKAITLVEGDFALALFDRKEQTLFLARDHFGIKPLYYFSNGKDFAFASQPRGLFKLPFVTKKINPEFTSLYAASHYRYIDNHPEQSPYQNIFQLPARHYLKFKNGRVETKQYWEIPDFSFTDKDENTLAEEYRALFLDSVKRRIYKSTKPAFTLSGGMDSSSVLASSVHLTGEKQIAYSTIYEDETYDESKEIADMLESTVSRWNSIRIGTPNLIELVNTIIRAHDEPIPTATWLAHYILCEHASQNGVKTLFGGLGGDELNAGEYEYFLYFFADLKKDKMDERLDTEITKWIEYHDHPIFKKNRAVVKTGFEKFIDFKKDGICKPDPVRMKRYYHTLSDNFFDVKKFVPQLDHPSKSYLRNRSYQDIYRETSPCSLRALDRNSNFFNLEHETPFFDKRLVEFMFRVPPALLIKEGVTKYLLRKSMHGILPEKTRNRIKKTGWNAPTHAWFAGSMKKTLLDLVHSSSFKNNGIYKADEVEKIIIEHDEIVSRGDNRENHMMFIWQMLNTTLWIENLNQNKI